MFHSRRVAGIYALFGRGRNVNNDDAHQSDITPGWHCKPHYSHSPGLANRYVLSSIRNFGDSIWLLARNARSRSSSNKLNSGISLGLALLVALSLDFGDFS